MNSIVKLHNQRLRKVMIQAKKTSPEKQELFHYEKRNYEGLFYIAKCVRMKPGLSKVFNLKF